MKNDTARFHYYFSLVFMCWVMLEAMRLDRYAYWQDGVGFWVTYGWFVLLFYVVGFVCATMLNHTILRIVSLHMTLIPYFFI